MIYNDRYNTHNKYGYNDIIYIIIYMSYILYIIYIINMNIIIMEHIYIYICYNM